MRKLLIVTLAAASVAVTQVSIGIRGAGSAPGAPSTKASARQVEAARPLLGYLADDSNILYAVVGSANNASWGEPLLLPDSTDRTFLPPCQEYALLSSDAGLAVARLSRRAVYPGALISQVLARPDEVIFSPLGQSAALVSHAQNRVEILNGLPSQPRLRWSLSLPASADYPEFAVSDDGELLLAASPRQAGALRSLHGEPWQPLPTGFWPGAWTFLPASHDLALIDRQRKVLVLLQHADRNSPEARVLTGTDVDADLLATTKSGSTLLAVRSGTVSSWSLDLVSAVVTSHTTKSKVDSLTLLRDGHTFLTSTRESPGVIALEAAPDQTDASSN